MKQQVIIKPDGSVSGLDFKKKGLPLTQLGKAKTKRVTDIVWDEESQKWVIKFLMGELEGSLLAYSHITKMGLPLPPVDNNLEARDTDGVLLFSDYDDAVSAEVFFIQAARRQGAGNLVGDA